MERVTIIEGKKPFIFVAPHGFDDINTALMASELADITNSYAVINRGWERSSDFDCKKEKANCNNVEHCHKDVVKEEFLDPIIRFKNRILKKWARVLIVYLHGIGNNIRKSTGIKDLHYVLGWGNGRPSSHSCEPWIKNFIAYHLSTGDNCKVGEGAAGGNYAAYSKNNMVQLFRKWYFDNDVDSLQIEVINDIRNTAQVAKVTAQLMAIVFMELVEEDSSWTLPSDFKIPKV